jgi:hypothetical protein
MFRKSLPLALVGLISTSCVFEFRPDAPFEGSYQLTSDCELTVDGSSASASCSSGETVQVSYSAGSITVDNISFPENISNSECWVERNCTRTYSGTIENKGVEGNIYEGRFGRFTGSWVGLLVLKTICTKEEAVASPPDWCAATTADRIYTMGAEVEAHAATVSWSTDDGASGELKAQETQGGVTVADEFYQRLNDTAAPTETPADAGTPTKDAENGEDA